MPCMACKASAVLPVRAGLTQPADRGRDAYLRPELVEVVLVVVVRPGLGDPTIPHMEHQHRWAADTAPVAFSVRAVQPDDMLVVGHHIMEGSPEGPTRTLDECPERPSTWSRPS